MVRIAFIEDDAFYLKSLTEAIHLQPKMTCMLGAETIEDFWERIPKRAQLDIIFIEIDLPGESGVKALPRLRRRFQKAELVMLTNYEDKKLLFQSFAHGATGYLLKDFPIMKLPVLINILRKGGALISPQMARWLIEFFNPLKNTQANLSEKELRLLRLFSEGNSYETSANMLGISVDGVKYRVKSIYKKLNVNNKIDAIRSVKDML